MGLLTGLIVVALLPAAAAMAAAGGAAPDVTMAITQPVVTVAAVTSHGTNAVMDSGILALVGTALMGLASLVRRTTRN